MNRQMRRRSRGLLLAMLGLWPSTVDAAGLTLDGRVFVGFQGSTPAKQVRVSLSGRNPTQTDDEGVFVLSLPPNIRPGALLKLDVTKPGHCVLHPFNGEVVLRTEGAVVVRLLRSPSRQSNTEDCLARFIEAVTQRPKPMSIAAAGDKPPPLDLPKELQAWATEQGVTLSKAEADSALQRWLTEVRAQPSRDAHTLGLAAFVEKRYAEACSLFVLAAEERERRLASHLIQERKAIAESYRMAGDSEYNLQAFGGALVLYQKALAHLGDPELRKDWAALQVILGNTHAELSTRVEGEAAAQHIQQSLSAYRSALQVYTREGLPKEWAGTQDNLGLMLREQAMQTQGPEGATLLAQAVSAPRLALEVFTRKDHPQDWARTQNNLVGALIEQAIRTEGEAADVLLTQATSACRLALEVRTRKGYPLGWAASQHNLGTALFVRAVRAHGELSIALLTQAIFAYRSALELYTRNEQPDKWAIAQNSLAGALVQQAGQTPGDTGTELLAQAVSIYRSTLEVRTRRDFPVEWARTQHQLGNALSAQACRAQGEASMSLLVASVAAYRQALEVRTRKVLPIDWARTQSGLGIALSAQAAQTPGDTAAAELLVESVTAQRSILDVYTRKDLPEQWARAQTSLGGGLSEQASRVQGKVGAELLAQSVAAYRLALDVYTRRDRPHDWAMTQCNLGNAISSQGQRTPGEAGTALLAQAVATFRTVLDLGPSKLRPQQWAVAQFSLGRALTDLGQRLPAGSAEQRGLSEQAIAAFKLSLQVHTQSAFPQFWSAGQIALAEASALLSGDSVAAAELANVLVANPDWREGYVAAYTRYHEKLFAFGKAFSLHEAWLARHAGDLVSKQDFIASHLTTGRLAEVSAALNDVWSQSKPEQQVPLAVIEIAALTGQGRQFESAAKLRAVRSLIAAQPAEFRLKWAVAGIRHFLQTDPRFASHQAQLLTLLSAAEQPNRDAILAALSAL